MIITPFTTHTIIAVESLALEHAREKKRNEIKFSHKIIQSVPSTWYDQISTIVSPCMSMEKNVGNLQKYDFVYVICIHKFYSFPINWSLCRVFIDVVYTRRVNEQRIFLCVFFSLFLFNFDCCSMPYMNVLY